MCLLLALLPLLSQAQERRISGVIIDGETSEAMVQTAVQLLSSDSIFITGGVSDERGHFTLTAPVGGDYLLKISSIGYVPQWKKITLEGDKDLDLGRIKMKGDAIVLKEITKTAQALKVVVVEDTFIYNSAAYRTPEGSVVEELVKRLPGATVDDDGNVTINGKAVERVKVDGREFMTGDTKTAIKNLPTSIIDKVKAYSDKSDNTKMTGIDDGEEIMTLDFGIKPGMNKGLLGNIDLAYGTRERYAERGMAAWMKDKLRVMAMGNFNNTNDIGFGGRGGGFSRGRNGLNTSNMAGVNVNYEETDKLKADGSVRWNHNTNDAYTRSSSEQFVTSETAVQSFANNLSQSFSKDKSFNAQARIEWKPDTMTTMMFRPSWSWSDNDGRSGQGSATFSADPYTFSSDPLADLALLEGLGIIKNSSSGSSLTYDTTRKIGGQAQVTRKFGSKGRNVSLRLEGNYSSSDDKNFSTSNVLLYGSDADYSINRYSLTPSKSWDYTVQTSYSEPVAKKTYIQLTYRYAQSYSRSARTTYDFSDISLLPADYVNLLASLGLSAVPAYRDWHSLLPDDYEDYIDDDLCRYSEYRTYTHTVELQLRRIRDNYNFNVGVQVQPQHTSFRQNYLGLATDTARNVINVSPTINFRYYFSRQHQLRLQYRGITSQPAMSDLVSITDNSDPLNITLGNPGLKPSFKHNLYFNYNNYIAKHNQVVELHGQMTATRNATTQRVTYDTTTGGRTTRPENINGNWDFALGGMYNIALDSLGRWNINSSTDYSFNHYVGLVSVSEAAVSQRNITKSHNVNERLAGSFRNDWLEIELDGTLNYTGSTNRLQPSANLDTWGISYGASTTITCPWGMSFSSDIHMKSRRGYNDKSLNTNELVWNAQAGQSFLKGKSLTITLQWYDILRRQSNLSRTISAMERQDTEYNAINAYGMLHVVYRFNVFGTKDLPEHHGPHGEGRRPDFHGDEFRPPRGENGPPPREGMPPGGPM
ncbi:MAG: outer membrane beta-barrel protein [Prevotella sp.]|nr:outer membrane beta-barrel protein [Prevotella sp.]